MHTTDSLAQRQSLSDVTLDMPVAQPNRRRAIQGAFGVGFAAAASPILAQQAIKTSSEGLVVGEVQYMVDGFKVPAYRAAPAGKKNLPVIVVVHEVFGVHEYIADVARRFAHAGYLAIAPELYMRQGDPSSYNEVSKLLAEVVNKVPDAQQMKDLDGAIDWAVAHGGNAAKVGITGFCRGGRTVWLYAAHSKKIQAAVSWYGQLSGAVSPLTPKHALQLAPEIQAPVLGLYGGADAGIAVAQVAQMQDALSKGSKAARASRFVLYPDTPHAFHADYRPTYRALPAQDGWKNCLAWFKAHGVA